VKGLVLTCLTQYARHSSFNTNKFQSVKQEHTYVKCPRLFAHSLSGAT